MLGMIGYDGYDGYFLQLSQKKYINMSGVKITPKHVPTTTPTFLEVPRLVNSLIFYFS